MDYTFTIADVAIIMAVCIVITILVFYMITDDGPPIPAEYTYKLGENATRMRWHADSGVHEIAIRLDRSIDKRPEVGDTVFFIEEGGARFRAKVLDVPYVVKLSGQRPQVLLTVKPLLRG